MADCARPTHEGLTIPAQINFVSKGAPLYELGYELDGSIFAISKYLSLTHLWEKIRVIGGAYGGFNIFDPNSGLFCYVSYRDPNLLVTLDNYDSAADYLLNLQLTEDQLRSAIIGAISNMDQHQLPDAKGLTSMQRYLTRVTDEMRQKYRDQVLSTRPEDFRKLGEILKEISANGDVVVLGSQDGLEKANAEKGGDWFTVTKVL
jgi:presequence protease